MKKGTQFLAVLLATTCISATVLPQTVSAASWKKDSAGWWYQEDNGKYPMNCWKFLNGQWYWFDSNGYMVTGWKKINNSWYYFDSNGCMTNYGWNQIGGNWYYMQKDGSMTGKGWHKINGSYYYMYSTGVMAKNTWIGNDYVDANGVWVPGKTKYTEGWKKSGNLWWYCHSDGTYTKNGWEKINGNYYYFDANGYMITGWKKVNGIWYYLKSNGTMMNNGWLKINGNWYYFNSDGSMTGKGWHKINGNYYYMYSSGAMATNTWIGNDYVDANGIWNHNKNFQLIKNKFYEYKSGELLSSFDLKQTSGSTKASLIFWHKYGDSFSDAEFEFTWIEGTWQYKVIENRSHEIFLLTFTPTNKGVKIKVTCISGEYFSWKTYKTATEWSNEEYI